MGGRLRPGSGMVVWCYVCVFVNLDSVLMAGPGICILCQADSCVS